MRHYTSALRGQLSRHRSSKTLSLKGLVPGLQPSHFRPGLRYAKGAAIHGSALRQGHSIYDMSAFYAWPQQQYQEPKPWFEGFFRGTPAMRIEGPPRGPFAPRVRYRDSLITPEMMSMAMEDLAGLWEPTDAVDQSGMDSLLIEADYDQELPGTSFHPEAPHADPYGAEPPSAQQDQHPWFDIGPMTQDVFDQAMGMPEPEPMMPSAMPEDSGPYGGMPDPFDMPGYAGLEQMVQEEMPMPDPFQQQQQLFDEQMQMMNPSMMPGFGPMGPMPFGP